MDINVNNIIRKKTFDLNYSNYSIEIVNIIDDITLSYNIIIAGSMAIRSMLYASDYDIYNIVTVENTSSFIKKIKKMINLLMNKPNYYIGDIKLGIYDKFRIINDNLDVNNYNCNEIKQKLEKLYDDNIITKEEYSENMKLLKTKVTRDELYEIIKKLRYHIVRWKPSEILDGYKVMADGNKYYMKDAIYCKTIFKIDLFVVLNDNNHQEFSCIYDLRTSDGKRINIFKFDIVAEFKKDISYLYYSKNYFKLCKRLFSLSNYQYKRDKNNKKYIIILKKLFYILNSDAGIIYNICQDINGLVFLLENYKNINILKIKYEIDGFINRLSNVYNIKSFLKNEEDIIDKLKDIYNFKNKNKIIENLNEIYNKLNKILNNHTFILLKKEKLL